MSLKSVSRGGGWGKTPAGYAPPGLSRGGRARFPPPTPAAPGAPGNPPPRNPGVQGPGRDRAGPPGGGPLSFCVRGGPAPGEFAGALLSLTRAVPPRPPPPK